MTRTPDRCMPARIAWASEWAAALEAEKVLWSGLLASAKIDRTLTQATALVSVSAPRDIITGPNSWARRSRPK